LFEGADEDAPAEETVRRKYDAQAAFYAAEMEPRLDPLLLGRLRDLVAPGGRILVAGSGTGPECLALEAEGWQVKGVDFSVAMVEQARKTAQARGSRVEYLQADLREHREPPGSLAAVFFTYEVYSFIRDAPSRIRVLDRMRDWLGKEGVVFLSARTVHGLYQGLLLTARFMRPGRMGPDTGEWGQSHTRWLSPAGDLSRSFVRIFTLRGLRRETRRAGYEMGPWQGAHAVLVPRNPDGGGSRA
jgi:SAM-dependent methyltransferase